MATIDLVDFCNNVDNSFGPTVAGECRGGFDFTLMFEQAFFTIAPCSLLLVASPFRIIQLHRERRVVSPDATLIAKLATISVFAALQLAMLVIWTQETRHNTILSVPSTAISFVSALAMGILSFYEHTQAIRPSTILNVFLVFTLLFDVASTRTLWLRQQELQLSAVFTAGVAVKLWLLVLEALHKQPLETDGKQSSPEALSGILGRSFFWWLNALFVKGFGKAITVGDLYPLEDVFSSVALGQEMVITWESANHTSRWALMWAVSSALKRQFFTAVPARLALMGFNFCQPFLITAAVDYFRSTPTRESSNIGYGLIGATALVYLGIAISNGHYNYYLYRSVTMIRGCLVSIIYQRTLQLKSSSAQGSAALTLMNADVSRIGLTVEKVFEILASVIEAAIALYLLERQIGWACIAPLILAAVAATGSTVIAKLIQSRVKQWNQSTQERVAMTSTVLRNIRPVKMMGLGPEVADSLQDKQRYEMDRSVHFRWFVAFMNLFGTIPKLLSGPLTFLLFIFSVQFFSEGGLSASRAFTTLSLLELMTTPLGRAIQYLPQVTAAFACFDRIQEYLLREGQEEGRAIHPPALEGSKKEREDEPSLAIEFSDAYIQYKEGSPAVLQGLTIGITERSLTMITGPVGCGKTTLLRAIVGDVGLTKGSLRMKSPEVAYCQQAPWLANTTVRENILGQSPEDTAWYKTVKTACALDEDIATFPDHDESLVGTGGITLSGGQRQRLALARAVYARTPLIALDDTFSALDAKTERAVFHSLLLTNGLLRRTGCTVIMVTHAAHHLPSADNVIVLNADGSLKHYGPVETEDRGGGGVVADDALDAGCEAAESTTPEQMPKATKPRTATATITKKDMDRRLGDVRCYSIYGKSMGWYRALLFLLIAILFAFCSRFTAVWVQWFTEGVFVDRSLFIGVYFLFAILAAALSLASFCWMMMVILPVSGISLHSQLLTAVFRAPLSFFTSVDMGVILNRFSQDIGFSTTQLPISTMNAVTAILVCIAQFALISVGSGYLAATIPGLIAVIWCLQKVYLSTSRQLRFLDLEQKSGLYTSLTETIEGLPTIRAFGWGPAHERVFLGRLEDSQRPTYLLYCIQRWLKLVLDLMVAGLAVLLVGLATHFRGTGSSGAGLGVALIGILGFSQSLSQFVFFYTELETALAAISRIKEFMDIQPEDLPGEDHQPHPEWPSKGAIRFENLSASYSLGGDLALKDVSIEIPSRQRVGIAGRTGSGKSSLVLTLIRLLDPSAGKIIIDGVDISTLPRQLIRSRITTIPQDPFFLPTNTIRDTIRGSRQGIDDAELLDVLDRVGLLTHAKTHLLQRDRAMLDKTGDRASQFSEGETEKILGAKLSSLSLSAGQLQLLCLARALLQDNRIVVLDEVTSSVDPETEKPIRRVLREGLEGRTVVMIAHRESMLAECDMVVHLDAGHVAQISRVGD